MAPPPIPPLPSRGGPVGDVVKTRKNWLNTAACLLVQLGRSGMKILVVGHSAALPAVGLSKRFVPECCGGAKKKKRAERSVGHACAKLL